MRFLVDIDDTITNFSDVLLKYLNIENNTKYKKSDVTDWNWYRNHFKYPWRQTELTDFWDKVIVDQKAKEIIENFVQNKHEVFLVTASFPNDSLGYKIRKTLSFFNENLINNNNIIICYNKFLIKGDVRIDDGIHNLSNDCINILIDQPWNQNVNENIDYYRIKTWDELRHF